MKREEEKTNGCLKKKGWGIEKERKEKRRRVSQGVRVYVDNVKDATLLLLSLLKDYQLIVQCLFMEDVVVTESSMSLTSAPSFLHLFAVTVFSHCYTLLLFFGHPIYCNQTTSTLLMWLFPSGTHSAMEPAAMLISSSASFFFFFLGFMAAGIQDAALLPPSGFILP